MSHTDAFTWAMEEDPRLRSTVVSLVLLDGAPDWDVVRARWDALTRTVPMFRKIIVDSPPPTPPRWEWAEDFDLDFHVRRVTAPEPGDLDTLLEMARVAAMSDFDRARPLWTATLIDGLADGGAALLCKLHHGMTDGVGGVQMAMTLFDLTEQPRSAESILANRDEANTDEPHVEERGVLSEYGDIVRYDLDMVGKAVSGTVSGIPDLISKVFRDPRQTAADAAELAGSLYRAMRPVTKTGSTLMTERSLVRKLAVHQVPLSALKKAARAGNGSLNDAFVAGITGGLRRYHDKHGVVVEDLHLTMPISLRTEDAELGGNHITLARFDVPAGIADPALRIAETRTRTTQARNEKSNDYIQIVAGTMNMIPRRILSAVFRHVDFLASDVPGIPVQVFFGGAPVRAQYAFGPTIGSAVNVTLLSYVDTCALGIDVDTGAIPDVDDFYDCLVAGFEEVLALAD